MERASGSRVFCGVSLKMYFDHRQTLEWVGGVLDILQSKPLVSGVDIVLLPSFTSLVQLAPAAAKLGVRLGAQNLAAVDSGAFTGEVSGRALAQVGCTFVEIGHAERRRFFGEDDLTIAAKLRQGFRCGLTPILCVGEIDQGNSSAAAKYCQGQLDSAFELTSSEYGDCEVVVAYEPVWAIGQSGPAPVSHVSLVCDHLRAWFAKECPLRAVRIVYGGSASSGLLTALGSSVDGLFLGRFAHSLNSFSDILDEMQVRAAQNVLTGNEC